MGWVQCGIWTIYDENGSQKNRVIGPYPLSNLQALGCQNSGVNICSGNPKGYAVLNGIYDPKNKNETYCVPSSTSAFCTQGVTDTSPVTSNNQTNSSGSTQSSTDTKSSTSQPTTQSSSNSSAPTGLGGYAVIHPDGHVCGVIVATSSDPYGNGGRMPIIYMGCPVGSRIVFQTNPSPSGNVAGWHGENVIYNGSEFVIKNNNSSSSTVQTTISGGVATDSNGRVWDTGSGATLKPGTTSASDTTTVRTDTGTVRTDTSTSTSNSSSSTTDTRTSTVSTSPQPLAITVAIPDSSTVTQVVKNLTPALLESQLVAKVVAKTQSIVQVNTDFANSLLQVVAVKKGSKTLNLSIQTDQNGDAKINLKSNLSGYSISLKAGNINLDTDKIK
jgi:hypothetical protein